MAYVMAGTAVVSSLASGSAENNDEWKAAAKKAGRNEAAITASEDRALRALHAKETAVADADLLARVEAEKVNAATVAEATVNAAAAGASGVNVDQTIQTLEGSTSSVLSNLEKRRRSSLLQLEQEKEDIVWDAHDKRIGVDTTGGRASGTAVIGAAALAGVSAYMQMQAR